MGTAVPPEGQQRAATAGVLPYTDGTQHLPRAGYEDDPVRDYADQVVSGGIVAGPHVRAACARHLRDLEDGHKRGLRFDKDLALYYIAFVENFLCLNGGQFEGRPFLLGLWQKFILGSLFGWLKTNGKRRFTQAYIEIGKGNGKSPLAAAIGLAGLIIDQEPRAEIYAAATKKDQAMILFRDAVAMVDQSPLIASRIQKSGRDEKVWNLSYPLLGSFFRPISADDGQSGPRPHVSLVDELHEHKSAAVLDMLEAGQKGREQPLLVSITNSGTDRQSVCYIHHEAGVKLVNAKPGEEGFDDSRFVYICALDVGDDWKRDPACWIKANPNLGVSIFLDYLERQVLQARNMPSKANKVARLNFCVWTDAEEAWIGAEAWLKCEVPLDLEKFRRRNATMGIDLSKRRDLTAVAYFVPDDAGGGDAFVDFWSPADNLADRAWEDKVNYLQWRDEGFLHAVPGLSVEYDRVCRDLRRRIDDLDLQVDTAAFDRWRIEEFQKELDKMSFDLPLKEFGQGFKDMAPAVERLENLLLNEKLRVHMNPVLRWNAASVVTEEDAAGNRKFTKRKATGRIDGIVALAMAVSVAVLAEGDNGNLDDFFRNPVI
ncbi:phage terminase small subunit P27 family [Solimonas fluminis]|uniref:Phage terminase small subunit P27 family n=1 Tax=Solimonas fluminis TaxID=2086571 RepID=A0A2S5TKD6_9GAMM|nr:terminase TerL endonuclease subunit [Solimonas fluminis]PPE75466.1 phage terminase small subunit P27 family [Solimonas fluminis]